MALLGRSKKKQKNAEPAEDEPQEKRRGHSFGRKRSSKQNAGSGLRQILHESVTETALDKFQNNDAFIHYDHGRETYIGLILNTADIGGLDKKSRKDEAKGSIIECINSGRIQTYLNDDLLDAGLICIIPDAMTLSAMAEFSLLTDAPYEFCEVDENGEVTLLGIKTNYEQVSDLVLDDGRIDSLLKLDEEEEDDIPDAGEEFGPEDEEEDEKDDEQIEDISDTDDIENTEDDIPDASDSSDDSIPDIDDDAIPDVEEVDIEIETEPEPEVSEEKDDVYVAASSAEEAPEQEIPQEYTDEAIVRKFYSDDLDLEVTSEPFDAQFIQGNEYPMFDENRGDSWLDQQLNEMSRSANLELSRMHRENQWQMRERYFKLVALACDRIRADLDVHDPDTQYGEMYAQISSDKQSSLDSIDRRVQKRKEELEKTWRTRLQEVGVEAARSAQHQYRERYSKQHDMEIYNIEASEKAAIEAEYQDSLHDMYDRRKVEASALLDISITDVLDEIAELYTTSLTEEKQKYDELDQQMKDFIDAHQKDDIAHTKALEEELRQTDKADKVLAEQTAKMENLSEEYRERREQLLDEMQQLKDSNAEHIASMKEQWEEDTNRWNQEKQNLNERYDDLLKQYQNLDDMKEKEFSSRFDEMRAENDALSDRNEHLVEVHRRSNIISAFLVVAIAVASLAIGFIGGEYINTQRRNELEQQQMVEAYEEEEERAEEDFIEEEKPEESETAENTEAESETAQEEKSETEK